MTRPDRIYAPKPAPGAIEQSFDAVLPRERPRLKAQALRALIQNATFPLSFALDGYRIQVQQAPTVFTWVTAEGDTHHGIEFVLAARVIGGRELPVDNPYRFVNPPVKVPNGTWRQETDATGEVLDVENTEERPLEAMQRVLLDTVLVVVRAQGAI